MESGGVYIPPLTGDIESIGYLRQAEEIEDAPFDVRDF